LSFASSIQFMLIILLEQPSHYACIYFDVHVTVYRNKFSTIKPTRCTKFSHLYWNETLHVSDSFSVHHQEFFTVHTAIRTVLLTACEQEHMLLLASCQQTCMTFTIAVCTVKNSWWWAEKLSETCRVSFQYKCENLAHLVDFIVRNLVSMFKPPRFSFIFMVIVSVKGKVVAFGVLAGYGSRISRHSAHEGGKVVTLTHRPSLPQGISWYSFFFRG